MKIHLKENKIALFSWLNQKEFIMRCTIFFSFTNAYYNWAFRIPTIEDIKLVGNDLKDEWKLSDKNWAYLIHSAEAVADYIWCNLITFNKKDEEFEQFLEKGYMIGIWISVNKDFYDDYKDGEIERYQDYINYQGDAFKHALNIYRWKGRFAEKVWDLNNEEIYDNYMGKKGRVNSINVDISEIKDILYQMCYVLI